MRFSGSIYDNLRQPGIYEALGQDEATVRQMVLARLRFDDLMSCDGETGTHRACIVLSRTDVLDGTLLAAVSPNDLEGINLEILAPGGVADSLNPVVDTVRYWMHDADGAGREALFMTIPDSTLRRRIASAVAGRKNLDIKTIPQAIALLKDLGVGEHARRLEDHWRRWESALGPGRLFKLKPFRSGAASASPLLKQFKARCSQEPDWGFGLTPGVGQAIFDRALSLLDQEAGRRDSPVTYLSQLREQSLSESERRELDTAEGLFNHFAFEAIALGNSAFPEHSGRVGPSDRAVDGELLDRVAGCVYQDIDSQIALPMRLVEALGRLSPSEYGDLKKKHEVKIARGMREAEAGNGPDELATALMSIAVEFQNSDAPILGPKPWVRRLIWTSTTLGGPILLELLLGKERANTGVKAAFMAGAALTGIVANKLLHKAGVSLLRRSILKATAPRIKKHS